MAIHTRVWCSVRAPLMRDTRLEGEGKEMVPERPPCDGDVRILVGARDGGVRERVGTGVGRREGGYISHVTPRFRSLFFDAARAS